MSGLIDWEYRDRLYEGMRQLTALQMRVIWSGHPDWLETLAVLVALYRELHHEVDAVNHQLDTSQPETPSFSKPMRIGR